MNRSTYIDLTEDGDDDDVPPHKRPRMLTDFSSDEEVLERSTFMSRPSVTSGSYSFSSRHSRSRASPLNSRSNSGLFATTPNSQSKSTTPAIESPRKTIDVNASPMAAPRSSQRPRASPGALRSPGQTRVRTGLPHDGHPASPGSVLRADSNARSPSNGLYSSSLGGRSASGARSSPSVTGNASRPAGFLKNPNVLGSPRPTQRKQIITDPDYFVLTDSSEDEGRNNNPPKTSSTAKKQDDFVRNGSPSSDDDLDESDDLASVVSGISAPEDMTVPGSKDMQSDKTVTQPQNRPSTRASATTSPEIVARPPKPQSSISSIGTTSPLVERLKKRARTTTDMELPQQPSVELTVCTIEDIEKRVQTFYTDLQEDVALMARCLLEDSRTVNKNAPKPILDETCPWTSTKAINIEDGPTRIKQMTTRIESRVNGKTNTSRTKAPTFSTIPVTTFKDNEPSVPKYTAITMVKRNFLIADDEVLRFIPYFDDDYSLKNPSGHRRLMNELEEAYSNSGLSKRETELCGQVLGYLDTWLPQCGLDVRLLQRYILHKKGHTLKRHKKVLALVLKNLGGPVSEEVAERAKRFTNALDSIFKLDVVDVVLPKSRLTELIQGLETSSDEEEVQQSHELFATFANWMCLVCGVAYCQVHGDYSHNPVHHVDDSLQQENTENAEYEYNYQPLGLTYNDLLRKNALRKANADEGVSTVDPDQEPCTEECYLTADDESLYDNWTQEKLDFLKEFAIGFTDQRTRSCNISLALDLPCWQVHRELQHINKSSSPSNNMRNRKVFDKPQWYNRESKVLPVRWDESTNAHKHEERNQLNTCAHDGPCTSENCGCYNENVLCERWCMCSDDCGRRFAGCSCAASGLCCNEDSCICIQMNRECGPECASCGAIERINPANKMNDLLFATGCQNVFIQRGVPKKALIGESSLEGVGFGLYITESAKKGDYISDYLGEIITFKESERRGIIYERKHSSFLFDLNSEWTIDGARHGNKSRFINHAATPAGGLNITAKIMLANGEHRIKFVALRDIKPGEELLFNYGKKFESHITKKLTLLGRKSANLLTSKDALDALDGLDSEKQASRRKVAAAIRGGRGGGGRGRARKTASPRQTGKQTLDDADAMDVDVLEGPETSESEGAEEDSASEEDGNEEEVEDRRPKRNIRKPKRYTR